MRDARRIVRKLVENSGREIGSEGIHYNEDYHSPTIGGPSDAGNEGSQPWAGAPGSVLRDKYRQEESPFVVITRQLDKFASSDLKEETMRDLFNMLVSSGLIEYMNDAIRSVAKQLIEAGAVEMPVQEGREGHTRDTEKQPAQQGEANLQVKKSGMKSAFKGTAPISLPGDTKSQPAHTPAKIEIGGRGEATTVGHADFPDSGGKAENPAGIPDAEGNTPPGPETEEKKSTQKMKVGNSLYQGFKAKGSGNYKQKMGKVGEEGK